MLFEEQMSAYFSKYDPTMFFFEVLNEPVFVNATLWNPILTRCLHALRRGAPNHTLIGDANAHSSEDSLWDGVDALTSIVPVANDSNIFYNFH